MIKFIDRLIIMEIIKKSESKSIFFSNDVIWHKSQRDSRHNLIVSKFYIIEMFKI